MAERQWAGFGSLRRRVAAIVAVPGVLLGALGCAGASPDQESADKTTMTIGMTEAPTSVEPLRITQPTYWVTMTGTAANLINYDWTEKEGYDVPLYDAENYTPGVVEEWEISDDGLAIDMRLREGVQSAWGNTLTTKDVEWTVQRDLQAQGGQNIAQFGLEFVGIDTEDPITVHDDLNFTLNFTKKVPFVEAVLAWWALGPLDTTYLEDHITDDDPWAEKFVDQTAPGFGPYFVDTFESGQQVVLKANPNYYGEKPEIQTITLRTIPDAGTRQQLLESGSIDLALDMPLNNLVSMEDKAENVRVDYAPPTTFTYISFDFRQKDAFTDPRVRQAMALAIPYDRIAEEVYFGKATRAQNPAPNLPGGSDRAYPYDYDPEAARELLAEAGYGPDKPIRGEVTYSTVNPGPENEGAAILVSDALKEIGVDLKVTRAGNEDAFATKYYAGEAGMISKGTRPFLPNISYGIYNFVHTNGGENKNAFSDPELDAAIERALGATSEADFTAAVAEAEELMGDAVPKLLLVNVPAGVAMNKDLSGYHQLPTAVAPWALFEWN